MISLTTTVFLDILRQRGPEIANNLDDLPISKLHEIKEAVSRAYSRRQDDFIKKLRDELCHQTDVWNQKYPKHEIISIGVNRSTNNDDRISVFVNIRNHELIVVDFSSNGWFYIRKNNDRGEWEWDIYNDYDPEIIIKRYPILPWIEEFSDWLGVVYHQYVTK